MAQRDFHLHTIYSDDSSTPAEVVAMAHQVGVTAMAITDHDIVDDVPNVFHDMPEIRRPLNGLTN